jgi:hypothetical protein
VDALLAAGLTVVMITPRQVKNVHRVAWATSCAHLLVSFPAAAGLFCRLESAVSLAFLARSGLPGADRLAAAGNASPAG